MMIKMYAINDNSWFEAAGSSTAIASIGIMTLFCLLTPVFLHCKKSQFKDPAFTAKYGSLVQDMRTDKVSSRFYYLFFMARRLIFTVLIVFVAQRPDT